MVLGGKGVASISDFEINRETIYYAEAAARHFDFFLSIPSAYHLHLVPVQAKPDLKHLKKKTFLSL